LENQFRLRDYCQVPLPQPASAVNRKHIILPRRFRTPRSTQ
jgi:hypothetical protein